MFHHMPWHGGSDGGDDGGGGNAKHEFNYSNNVLRFKIIINSFRQNVEMLNLRFDKDTEC